MILDDWGTPINFVARALKNKKIHFFMIGNSGETFKNSFCHHATRFDDEDEVQSIEKLKAILKDKRMCKTCSKDIKNFISNLKDI